MDGCIGPLDVSLPSYFILDRVKLKGGSPPSITAKDMRLALWLSTSPCGNVPTSNFLCAKYCIEN
jgi:hypothetical protein